MEVLNLQFIHLLFITASVLLSISDCIPVPGMDFICDKIPTRNLVQFCALISTTVGNPSEYNGYGCWCGKGHRGDFVVDATDFCCQVHDKCYEALEQSIAKCSPSTAWYSYTRSSNNDIQCNDPAGTCDYGTCLCDKAAVNCFARHRNTSFDSDFANWKGLCTEIPKVPQLDSERCPPVWNDREQYLPDTLVSVHGIKYQALFPVGPGGNPEYNFVTSNSLGVQATWKKLGPCRRMNEMDIYDVPANGIWSTDGVTVAGGNGPGHATNQLDSPFDLFVDDDQTVVIADKYNHRIIEWKKGATNGRVIAGGNGPGNRLDQLDTPGNVLIDNETDSVIIADWGNNRVVRWSRTKDTKEGEILINNIGCRGLAMDHQRYLYASDNGRHEVRRYRIGDRNGILVAGGNGQGYRLDQLNYPSFVFVDWEQSVYVSDKNHRVMKWNKDAKEGVVAAGDNGYGTTLAHLNSPAGIFVDTLGTLYVTDSSSNQIRCWSKGDRQGSVIAGGNGRGEAANQFKDPYGLSFDRYGNLYVADHDNHRIQRFDIKHQARHKHHKLFAQRNILKSSVIQKN